MILTELTLKNYGPFREATFDLAPNTKKKKPVILFGGKNGCGKTNVLESFRLALYGKSAFGNKVSEKEYLEFLKSRIHRGAADGRASITLKFDYSREGHLDQFEVIRAWDQSASGGLDVSVLKNGRPLDEIGRDYWDEFLRDLLPPSLCDLFFFDGERIQELASDDARISTAAFADSVKSLLNLSIVEKLMADLAVLERKKRSESGSLVAKEIETLQLAKEELDREVTVLRDKREGIESHLDREKTQKARLDQRFVSRGGSLGEKRQELLTEEATLRERLQAQEQDVRSLLSEHGNLLFARDEFSRILDSIDSDLSSGAAAVLSTHADKITSALSKALTAKALKGLGIQLPENQTAKLRDFLSGVIVSSGDSDSDIELSGLTSDIPIPELHRVRALLDATLEQDYSKLKGLGSELERILRQLEAVKTDLARVPKDDDLADMLREISAVSQRIGTFENQVKEIDSTISDRELKLGDIKRKISKLVESLEENESSERTLVLIDKVKRVADRFGDTLLEKRLKALESEVLGTFNQLARKSEPIQQIIINPENFQITVFDAGGPISKDRLSAGERQLLAISVLWSLARLSGRPLPMVIDTPLARLDSDHRSNLIHRYFCQASHQMIVLSTDTEVDSRYFDEMTPYVSRSYHLEYNDKERFTTASEGYFWSHA